MKEYKKPILEVEELEIDDIIATSDKFGQSDENDSKRSFSLVFGGK